MIAEFVGPQELLDAAAAARDAGYTQLDAFSPFPIHGLHEAVGMHRTRLPLVVLIGGIIGTSWGPVRRGSHKWRSPRSVPGSCSCCCY